MVDLEQRKERLFEQLRRDAEAAGYHLNPDRAFVYDLIEGLLTNEERFGYLSCPCRLAAGSREEDLDILCPCDYRDPDLDEHGACYCALYVSEEVLSGRRKVASIPERRRRPQEKAVSAAAPPTSGVRLVLPYPVWRCRVCGYLCAREHPPGSCPVCKAGKDRFEPFL
ncbi:MAG: ferredoxin:glutaredoxin reductase [Deltaproteobacteria bacterium]|nr:ferredoxin:glutaredoxin reductase [Deltaproteobacteria bacterium]